MEITIDQVKTLRDRTGAGIMDCKRALEDARGDIEEAAQAIKDKGIAKAEQKSDRETREGVVEAYVHRGSRIGAMVELNCETDFVSRLPEFKELAHHLTMQVAAMGPEYVDKADMPEDDGRDPEEVCLLLQPFIRDDSKIIQDLVTDLTARVGENIRVRRLVRFALGE